MLSLSHRLGLGVPAASLLARSLTSSLQRNIRDRNISRRSTPSFSTKITPENLISFDIVKVALTKKTMVDVGKDGKSLVKVPIPESAKATGILPEGFSIDYLLDPATAIDALAKNNMRTMEQVPVDLLEQLREQINAAQNLTIARSFMVEGKREAIDSLLKEEAEEAAQAKKSKTT